MAQDGGVDLQLRRRFGISGEGENEGSMRGVCVWEMRKKTTEGMTESLGFQHPSKKRKLMVNWAFSP